MSGSNERENGYVAVDCGNQIDIMHARQAQVFCKAVEEKELEVPKV